MRPRPLEKKSVDTIIKALLARGADAKKTHGSNMQARGLPDILGTYPVVINGVTLGVSLGIEVKRIGRRPDPHELERATPEQRPYVELGATLLQAYRLHEMAQRGAFVAVIQTVEEAIKLLDNIDTVVVHIKSGLPVARRIEGGGY